jgi:hypothetical protein
MLGGRNDDLTSRLWKTGSQPVELEKVIRTCLGKFSIPVERVDHAHGILDCVVLGPLSPLDKVSIGVVRETLREWLPSWVDFRITTLASVKPSRT